MIPDYQSLMLPLLRLAEDGLEHRIGDVIKALGQQLGLTQAELTEMLPSGRQQVFNPLGAYIPGAAWIFEAAD